MQDGFLCWTRHKEQTRKSRNVISGGCSERVNEDREAQRGGVKLKRILKERRRSSAKERCSYSNVDGIKKNKIKIVLEEELFTRPVFI